MSVKKYSVRQECETRKNRRATKFAHPEFIESQHHTSTASRSARTLKYIRSPWVGGRTYRRAIKFALPEFVE